MSILKPGQAATGGGKSGGLAGSLLVICVLFAAIPPLAQAQIPGGAAADETVLQDMNYRMRPGDTVRVVVFDEPELAVEGRLDAEGRIQCALIGMVTLGQLTAREAAQAIEAAYRQDYLVRPEVTVSVLGYARRMVTVLGQVNRPGAIELPEGRELNILQVLGMAGGTTRLARLGKVRVTRRVDGQERAMDVDVTRHLSGKEKTPFMVREGDVITISASWF
jgi:protein involved in polysaccharide export with SLBB domain